MAVVASKGIFIVGAKRTPFCKYGGSLRELPASYAFAAAAKDALRSASIDAEWVDGTVVGNVNFLSQCDGGKTPRYCGIYSGVPLERPALGVNKACGSGLQAVISGALDILTTPANITLTGGTDIMSAQPLFVRNTRFGTALGASYKLEDYITQTVDSHSGLSLNEVAEAVAKKYRVGRQEADEFAMASNLKWKAAQESGILNREITPVTVEIRNKEIVVDQDETHSPGLTKSGLKERPALLENGSVVTCGNSSAPSDGAAVIILASEEAITRHHVTPLARLVGWAGGGGEAGLGASAAVKELMRKTGRKIEAVDLVEFSETFAALTLALATDLNVDPGKLNTGGGALAMGHPVSATGARMITHLVYELGRLNLKTGLAASNCGGGQGVALMLEKI